MQRSNHARQCGFSGSDRNARERNAVDGDARLFRRRQALRVGSSKVHDETALLEALRDKRIAGAGLDVWSKEPPPSEHPLLAFDNVLASPHTAGITHQARVNMGRIAAEQLIHALDCKPISRVVNPEVWPLYAQRFERTLGFAPRQK